jgi:hypothetical protein
VLATEAMERFRKRWKEEAEEPVGAGVGLVTDERGL